MSFYSMFMLIVFSIGILKVSSVQVSTNMTYVTGTTGEYRFLVSDSRPLSEYRANACSMCTTVFLKSIELADASLSSYCSITTEVQLPMSNAMADTSEFRTEISCDVNTLSQLLPSGSTSENFNIPINATSQQEGISQTATLNIVVTYVKAPIRQNLVPQVAIVTKELNLTTGEAVAVKIGNSGHNVPSTVSVSTNNDNVVVAKTCPSPADTLEFTGISEGKIVKICPTAIVDSSCVDAQIRMHNGKTVNTAILKCPSTGRRLLANNQATFYLMVADHVVDVNNTVSVNELTAFNGMQDAGTGVVSVVSDTFEEECLTQNDTDTSFEAYDGKVRKEVNCASGNWDGKYAHQGKIVCYQLLYKNIMYGAVIGVNNRINSFDDSHQVAPDCSQSVNTPLALQMGQFLCRSKFGGTIATRKTDDVDTNTDLTTMFQGLTAQQYRTDSCSRYAYSDPQTSLPYQCCSVNGISTPYYAYVRYPGDFSKGEDFHTYCRPPPQVYPLLRYVVLKLDDPHKSFKIVTTAFDAFVVNPFIEVISENTDTGVQWRKKSGRVGEHIVNQEDTRAKIECKAEAYDDLFPLSPLDDGHSKNMAYGYSNGKKACDSLKEQLYICNKMACVNSKCYMWDHSNAVYSSTNGFVAGGGGTCSVVNDCHKNIDVQQCMKASSFDSVFKQTDVATGNWEFNWYTDVTDIFGKQYQSTQIVGFGYRYCGGNIPLNGTSQDITEAVSQCTLNVYKNELSEDLVSPDLDQGPSVPIKEQFMDIVTKYAKYGPTLNSRDFVLYQDAYDAGHIDAGYAGFKVTAMAKYSNPNQMIDKYGDYSIYQTSKYVWTKFQEDPNPYFASIGFDYSVKTPFLSYTVQDTEWATNIFNQTQLPKLPSVGAKFMTLLCNSRMTTWFDYDDYLNGIEMSWEKRIGGLVVSSTSKVNENAKLKDLATRLLGVSPSASTSLLSLEHCHADVSKDSLYKLDYAKAQDEAKFYATPLHHNTTEGQIQSLDLSVYKLSYDSRTCKSLTTKTHKQPDLKVFPVPSVQSFKPIITRNYCQKQDTMIKLKIDSNFKTSTHSNTLSWFYLYAKICDKTKHADGLSMTKRGFATYHILHNGTTINDSPSWQPNVPRTGYGIFTEYDQTTKETCKYIVPHMKNYSHDVLKSSSTSKWDKVLTKTVEQVMTKDEHRAARTLGFLSEIQYAPALYFDGKVELDISFRVADCYDPTLPGCRYYDSEVVNTYWTVSPRTTDNTHQRLVLEKDLDLTQIKDPYQPSRLPLGTLPKSTLDDSIHPRSKQCRKVIHPADSISIVAGINATSVNLVNGVNVTSTVTNFVDTITSIKQNDCGNCGTDDLKETYFAMTTEDVSCTSDIDCDNANLTGYQCHENSFVRARYRIYDAWLSPTTKDIAVFGNSKYEDYYWQEAFTVCPQADYESGKCNRNVTTMVPQINQVFNSSTNVTSNVTTSVAITSIEVVPFQLLNVTDRRLNIKDVYFIQAQEYPGYAEYTLLHNLVKGIGWATANNERETFTMSVRMIRHGVDVDTCTGVGSTEPLAISSVSTTSFSRRLFASNNVINAVSGTYKLSDFNPAYWPVANDLWKQINPDLYSKETLTCESYPTQEAYGQPANWLKLSKPATTQLPYAAGRLVDPLPQIEYGQILKSKNTTRVGTGDDVECVDVYRASQLMFSATTLSHHVVGFSLAVKCKGATAEACDAGVLQLKDGKSGLDLVFNKQYGQDRSTYNASKVLQNLNEKHFSPTADESSAWVTVDPYFSYANLTLKETSNITHHVALRDYQICILKNPEQRKEQREVTIETTWTILDKSLNANDPNQFITQTVSSKLVLMPELKDENPNLRIRLLNDDSVSKDQTIDATKENQGRVNMLYGDDISYKAITQTPVSFVPLSTYMKYSPSAKYKDSEYAFVTFVACKARPQSLGSDEIENAVDPYTNKTIRYCATNIESDNLPHRLMYNDGNTYAEFNENTRNKKAFWILPKNKTTLLHTDCVNETQHVETQYHMFSQRMVTSDNCPPKGKYDGNMFLFPANMINNIWIAVCDDNNIAARVSIWQMDDANAQEKYNIIKNDAGLFEQMLYQERSPLTYRSSVLSVEVLAQSYGTQELGFLSEQKKTVNVDELQKGINIEACSTATANYGTLYVMFLAFRIQLEDGTIFVEGQNNYLNDDTCHFANTSEALSISKSLFAQPTTAADHAYRSTTATWDNVNGYCGDATEGESRTNTNQALVSAKCKTQCYENYHEASTCAGDVLNQKYTGFLPSSAFTSSAEMFQTTAKGCGAMSFTSSGRECKNFTIVMQENSLLNDKISWPRTAQSGGTEIVLGLIHKPDHQHDAQVDSALHVARDRATITLSVQGKNLKPKVNVDMTMSGDQENSNSPCKVFTTDIQQTPAVKRIPFACLTAKKDWRLHQIPQYHIAIAKLNYQNAERVGSVVLLNLKSNMDIKTMYRNGYNSSCVQDFTQRPVISKDTNAFTCSVRSSNNQDYHYTLSYYVSNTKPDDIFSIFWDKKRNIGSKQDIVEFDLDVSAVEEYDKYEFLSKMDTGFAPTTSEFVQGVKFIKYQIDSPLFTTDQTAQIDSIHLASPLKQTFDPDDNKYHSIGTTADSVDTQLSVITGIVDASQWDLVTDVEIKLTFPDNYQLLQQWIYITYKEDVKQGKTAHQTADCQFTVTSDNHAQPNVNANRDYYQVVSPSMPQYDVDQDMQFAAIKNNIDTANSEILVKWPYDTKYVPARVLNGTGYVRASFKCKTKVSQENVNQKVWVQAGLVQSSDGIDIEFVPTEVQKKNLYFLWTDETSRAATTSDLTIVQDSFLTQPVVKSMGKEEYIFQSDSWNQMTFEGAASINVEGLSYQSYQQTIFSIGDAIDPTWKNTINSLSHNEGATKIIEFANNPQYNLGAVETVTFPAHTVQSALIAFAKANSSNMMTFDQYVNYNNVNNMTKGTYVDTVNAEKDATTGTISARGIYAHTCSSLPCTSPIAFMSYKNVLDINELMAKVDYQGNSVVEKHLSQGTTETYNFDVHTYTLSKTCTQVVSGIQCSPIKVADNKRSITLQHTRQDTVKVAFDTDVDWRASVGEISAHEVSNGQELCKQVAGAYCPDNGKYFTTRVMLQFVTDYGPSSSYFVSPTDKFNEEIPFVGSGLGVSNPSANNFGFGITNYVMNATDGRTMQSSIRVRLLGSWRKQVSVTVLLYSAPMTAKTEIGDPMMIARQGVNGLTSETVHVVNTANAPGYKCAMDKKCTLGGDNFEWKFSVSYQLPITNLQNLIATSQYEKHIVTPLYSHFAQFDTDTSVKVQHHSITTQTVNVRSESTECIVVAVATDAGKCSSDTKFCDFNNQVGCNTDNDCKSVPIEDIHDYALVITDVHQQVMKGSCWLITQAGLYDKSPNCNNANHDFFSWWSNADEVAMVFKNTNCKASSLLNIIQDHFKNPSKTAQDWTTALFSSSNEGCRDHIINTLTNYNPGGDGEGDEFENPFTTGIITKLLDEMNPVRSSATVIKGGNLVTANSGCFTRKFKAAGCKETSLGLSTCNSFENTEDKWQRATSGNETNFFMYDENRVLENNGDPKQMHYAYDAFCQASNKFVQNTFERYVITLEVFLKSGMSVSRRLLVAPASNGASVKKMSHSDSSVGRQLLTNAPSGVTSDTNTVTSPSFQSIDNTTTTDPSNMQCQSESDDCAIVNGGCCVESEIMEKWRWYRWLVTTIWTGVLGLMHLYCAVFYPLFFGKGN